MIGVFIVLGVIGAIVLVVTLLFDDFVDELIPGLGFLSGPVVGAFLVAFGAFGWFAGSGIGAETPAAIAAAVAGGALFGGVTYKFTRALMNQHTDATPTTSSLIGSQAKVVTPIAADGLGEVLVSLGGASTKYTATANVALPIGTTVVVTAVESATKVRVEATSSFWS